MAQVGVFILCLVAFLIYQMIINLLEGPKPQLKAESEEEKRIRLEKQLRNETLTQHNKLIANYQDENRKFYKLLIGKKISEDNWITWKHNLGILCHQEIKKESFLNGTNYNSLGISRQISEWKQLDLIPGIDYNKIYSEIELSRINQKTHLLVKEVCIDIQKFGNCYRYTGEAPKKYYYDDYK